MGDMQESLCGCFNDCGICFMGCLCPCYINATAKAQLDARDCTCCDCICPANAYQTRQSIRGKYGYAYSPCSDCCAAWFCGGVWVPVWGWSCFLCQNSREIKAKEGK